MAVVTSRQNTLLLYCGVLVDDRVVDLKVLIGSNPRSFFTLEEKSPNFQGNTDKSSDSIHPFNKSNICRSPLMTSNSCF